MRFFKNKKLSKSEIADYLFPNDAFPEVIKESKIKRTTCRCCHSIYQAQHKHIMRERDMSYLDKHLIGTICPVCGCHNAVEFEGGDTNGDKKD